MKTGLGWAAGSPGEDRLGLGVCVKGGGDPRWRQAWAGWVVGLQVKTGLSWAGGEGIPGEQVNRYRWRWRQLEGKLKTFLRIVDI